MDIPKEESRNFLESQEVPTWQKLLNVDASNFEKSKYAADGQEKFRLKDLNLLREIAPGIYESAAGEVKEYNDAMFETRGTLRKYKLGRKLGSIPTIDMALHPELAWDKKAQDKYFQDHPEMRTRG